MLSDMYFDESAMQPVKPTVSEDRRIYMSSLRVMMPSGAIVSVLRATPITEKIISFNGEKRRFVGVARDMKREANGVLINVVGISKYTNQGSGDIFDHFNPSNPCTQQRTDEVWDDVVIGNLQNGQVQEIMRELCEKGYYDFSRLEYQNVEATGDLKLGSRYLPYNNENKSHLCIFSNRRDDIAYNKFGYEDITISCGDMLSNDTPVMKESGEKSSNEEQ